jgi:hypothetical protein
MAKIIDAATVTAGSMKHLIQPMMPKRAPVLAKWVATWKIGDRGATQTNRIP